MAIGSAALGTTSGGGGGGGNSTIISPLGAQLSAASVSVVLASDQAAIGISTITPGTAATNLGKAEDAPHASSDVGVFALVVRSDSPANTAGTTGDYSALINDVNGTLYVNNAYKLDSTNDSITAIGNKTHNNAVPGATNIGALIGLANAAQPTYTETDQVLASFNLRGSMRHIIQDAALNDRGANVTAANELLVRSDTTVSQSYGTYTAMTVTNLQSLASSATAGWQSARIDNQTTLKALDYEIFVKLTTANTAPANDKVAYVYISPAITTDGGTTWLHTDQGTTTLPTGTEGTSTIASPNDLILLGTLSYTTQQMVMQKGFLLSNALGQFIPSGFSIIIVNFTGAALSTACVVSYRPINITNA